MDERSGHQYNETMPKRVRHALRFAIATLVAVYAAGAAWELLDIYGFGNVAEGASPRATFLINEQVWRTIALVEMAVVFLLRLGDVQSEPPGWGYAWFSGGWVALATLGVGLAVLNQSWWLSLGVAVASIALWYVARDQVPGRPGQTAEYEAPAFEPTGRELR